MHMKVTKEELVRELKNVRIVFGNGADLYCGLKTSYSDFFENQKHLYSYIDNSFRSFYGVLNDNTMKLLEITFYIESDLNMQPWLKNQLTIWDLLFYFAFKAMNKDIDKGILWCDVEKIIHDSFVKSSVSDSDNTSIIRWDIVDFLLGKKDIDKKDPLHSFVASYSYVLKNKIRGCGDYDFFTFLKNELILFEKKFGKYIEKETSNIRGLTNKRVKLVESLANISKISSIDTFNYSKMSFGKHELEQRHINGDYLNPIFGIDKSFDDLKKNRLIVQADEFVKTSRRIEQDLLDNQMTSNKAFDHVVVFGHSLNQQDYSYFYPLLDQIKINDTTSTSKFVIAYHIYDDKKSEEIRRGIKQNLLRFFSSYEKEHLGSFDGRLLDYLTTQNRIILYCI